MSYEHLEALINIDSPTGYTHKACQYVFELLTSYGYSPEYTNKGAVRCKLGENPTLAIAAHTDTLGGMVSKIYHDGSLQLTSIGGLHGSPFEGEYVKIITLDGKTYTGTLLFNDPSLHVNRSASDASRSLSNMHIRIDEEVFSARDTENLGIRVGDFVCFEPRYQELPSGYIKSRFIDNKSGCYVAFEIARIMSERKKSLPVELFFSNYEEVGHGACSGFSETIKELIVIDMGVVGQERTGSELCCSICAKDSSGPYDYHLRQKLVSLAEKYNIPHRIDIYPYYSSDGSAALTAGKEYRVALIGPGVSASHGMERTHKKGIQATIQICIAYIDDILAQTENKIE